MKDTTDSKSLKILKVSIRRADYWLVEVPLSSVRQPPEPVSIRRADYWLVEVIRLAGIFALQFGFNPPGGLLVG